MSHNMSSNMRVVGVGGLLLMITLCQGVLDHQQASHEWLIGWKGESYSPIETWRQQQQQIGLLNEHYTDTSAAATAAAAQPPAAAPAGTAKTIDLSQQPTYDGKRWVQILSWQPRLQLQHNFLSHKECDELLKLTTGSQQQQGGVNQVADDLLYVVEQRLANWTTLPPTNIEGWQLHHGVSAAEESLHTDLLIDRLATEDYQRTRTATVIIFLSDTDAQQSTAASSSSGGSSSSSRWSLLFPWALSGNWRGVTPQEQFSELMMKGQQVQQQLIATGLSPAGQHRKDTDMLLLAPVYPSSSSSASDICAGSSGSSLRLTGFKKGSALLIWNTLVDGQTPDATAAHVVCNRHSSNSGSSNTTAKPWTATTWFHNMAIDESDPLTLAAVCEDKNPACGSWASQGYCDDAPGIMLGLRGLCRHSCHDCNNCQQQTWTTSSSSTAAGSSSSSSGTAASSRSDYIECLYRNMHSLRSEWSTAARGAGVRRARNAIRREMNGQTAAAAAAGVVAGQRTWEVQ